VNRRSVSEVHDSLVQGVMALEPALAGSNAVHGFEIAFAFTSPALVDGTHPFFEPLIRSAQAHAALLGIDVVSLAPSRENWLEMESLERCSQESVAGLVVFGGADGNPDVLRQRWPGLATVFVEYDTLGTRSAHVGMDNEKAFAELVLHLVTLKRARIATITGRLDSRPASERLNGYRDVLSRKGYGSRPEYVYAGDWNPLSGYEGMQKLLALDDPPDAVACACDAQAIGAMQAIQDAGLRCPEDIAVTGFDDAFFAAEVTPGLTTVRQPAVAIGIAAIDAVVSMVTDPDLPPPNVLEDGELIIRESCGAQLNGAGSTSTTAEANA
jgi:DNA-binding LacI/PurR family transcriptional regulator